MKTTEHIHFIGIGGYGMSAIARVLLQMGYTVSGSDVAASEATAKLQAQGATVHIGHAAGYVEMPTLLYTQRPALAIMWSASRLRCGAFPSCIAPRCWRSC